MKNVMIASPGRSGTSMVAGLFKRQNYFFGKKSFRRSKRFNKKGFFEDPEINKLNEKLLKNAGVQSSHGTRRPKIGQRWLRVLDNLNLVAANNNQNDEMRRLIGRQAPFCYKDPRFCYTLHTWLPHLDLSNTVFVCIVRHPVETAMSIERFCRGMWCINMPVEEGLRLWACTFHHVIYNHRMTGEWLFLDFDGLLDNVSYQQKALDHLDALTGTTVDRGFIDRELPIIPPIGNNNFSGITDLQLREQVKSLYETACQLCKLE